MSMWKSDSELNLKLSGDGEHRRAKNVKEELGKVSTTVTITTVADMDKCTSNNETERA